MIIFARFHRLWDGKTQQQQFWHGSDTDFFVFGINQNLHTQGTPEAHRPLVGKGLSKDVRRHHFARYMVQ